MVKTKTEIKKIIKDSMEYLRKKVHISSAYIFGSYATGTATRWSDIDLAVFSPDADKMGIEDKARLAADLRLHCHTEVELHLFSQKALKEARPTNFYGYILKKGNKIL
ncbi:MAG: nucleotidyltransferase domain-containing protein [Thermodesulfovibrionia bacterium]|nr:nucleotidyltransferase domain-containing protein [Thermodesulfovibrionia bacterium]